MATRNVVLTARQDQLIDVLVRSGRYQNASEVLREGLRLIEQREAEDAAKLEALREAARQGMESFEQGRFRSFEDPKDLDRYLKDLAANAIAQAKRRR
jgi:antitoxin ParD1/3/4